MRRLPPFPTELAPLARAPRSAYAAAPPVRALRAREAGPLDQDRRRALQAADLPDAWTAAQLARSLERFRPHPLFPALIAQSANELLLEFVEGRPLAEPLDEAGCDRLAGFFAVLYAQGRHAVETRGVGFARRCGWIWPFSGAWACSTPSALAGAGARRRGAASRAGLPGVRLSGSDRAQLRG